MSDVVSDPVRVLLVLGGNPHRGAKDIMLPGVPRVGDTIRDYGHPDGVDGARGRGPYLSKVKQVIWDTEQEHVEVWIKL